MSAIEFSLFFRCKQDHEQKLDFGPGFSEDMVHDFGVLIAGGTLRSLDKPMPGFPCTTCGQPVGFSMVDRRKGRQEFLDAEAARSDRDQPVTLDAAPVDRSARTTLHGTPIGEHLEIEPSGMQRDYIVLSDDERAKGFVRAVRYSYLHTKCGTVTTMGAKLAETYARDPGFYSGTFCAKCRSHFPVGPDGEFTWDGTDQKVGT